jgi:hypothetical protein
MTKKSDQERGREAAIATLSLEMYGPCANVYIASKLKKVCGHPLCFHNPCSKCPCTGFVSSEVKA